MKLLASAFLMASLVSSACAPGDGPVAIQTQLARPSVCTLIGPFRGVLVADATWGLAVVSEPPDPRLFGVVWPRGYSAKRVDGRIFLVNASGAVLAGEGDKVELGGGRGADPLHPCGEVIPGWS